MKSDRALVFQTTRMGMHWLRNTSLLSGSYDYSQLGRTDFEFVLR